MRLFLLTIIVTLFSCGQRADNKNKSPEDTLTIKKDTTALVEQQTNKSIDSLPLSPTALAIKINEMLRAKYQNQWQVVNDSVSKWPKDVFDYFIAGKRKQDPDYPYIATGDFNIDGKPDFAALTVNEKMDSYRIAIILSADKIVLWADDVQGAAIANQPQEKIGGIDGKVVKMKGDGINVEFFEKSSWIIYWNGSAFKKIWTGD